MCYNISSWHDLKTTALGLVTSVKAEAIKDIKAIKDEARAIKEEGVESFYQNALLEHHVAGAGVCMYSVKRLNTVAKQNPVVEGSDVQTPNVQL
jgi:hypothetical protein